MWMKHFQSPTELPKISQKDAVAKILVATNHKFVKISSRKIFMDNSRGFLSLIL